MLPKSSGLQNLDWDEIKIKISELATSAPARDFLLETSPFESEQEATNQLLEIDEVSQILKGGIRPYGQSLDLFENWFLRLKKTAVLTPLEFKDLRLFLNEVLSLRETLTSYSSPFIQSSTKKILNTKPHLEQIEKVFTLSGDIREDASKELFSLYREKESLWKQIHTNMDRLVKAHSMEPYLQDKYVTTREGRWVLPIRGGSQSRVKGLMHGHSQTKQTVFIEPEEIVPLNNRIIAVVWEIEQEIEKILTDLSAHFSLHTHSLQQARDLLFLFDCRLAQAQFSIQIQASKPSFSESVILLKDLKHPLLALENKEIVPNQIEIGIANRILLLTGPNAGGKTVLLKAIGLACQMGRCGLPICAENGSQIPFLKKLKTIIGDAQSVDHHLSTFAAHLKALNEAKDLSGQNSLLLIDEICGSTDPEEGSALARSFIERYEQNQIFAVITSHLGPLKMNWPSNSAVQQGSMHYDEKSGRPTFMFIKGLPGESLALQTAKRVGIELKIIDRAYELLSPETRAKRQVLDEVERIKSDLLSTREDLKTREKEVAKLKQRLADELAQFEQIKAKELENLIKKTKDDLENQIAAAKAHDTFKKFEKLDQIKHNLPQIVSGNKSLHEEKNAITNAEEFAKAFPPGSKVFIRSLGQDGLIQGQPNQRGEVPILSNSLRLNITWKDLIPAAKPVNPTQRINRLSGVDSQFPQEDKTLDLRGFTVEDALAELEMTLDQGVRSTVERLKIIHGHGTEALKRAIRAYLSRSVYVKKWKAGPKDQGGDGMTLVELGQD